MSSGVSGTCRHDLLILCGDALHARDNHNAAHHRPRNHQKTVCDCESESLLPDLQAENLRGSFGCGCQTRSAARDACAQCEQPMARGQLAGLDAKAQHVRVELFARGEEMLQEGDASFAPEQSDRLKVARERQHVDGARESAGVDHFQDDGSHQAVES